MNVLAAALTSRTLVPIGLACVVAGTLLVFGWTAGERLYDWLLADQLWKQSSTERVKQLEDRIEAMNARLEDFDDRLVGKKSPDGWHRPQMRVWTRDLAERNPQLVVPVVPEGP